SPLKDGDDEIIATRLGSAVLATVKGNLLIGLIQGAMTGLGFLLFGVPNAALWGSVAAVMALVPGLGTAIVILPAAIFLFLTGDTTGAIGLLVWGIAAVGLIDNFLGPRLVGMGLKLHPLAVFLAVLGGLSLFGPIGFLLGPLTLSVCLALIDIYFSLQKKLH
ncbi:AI-2E family transporter, partial [Candidatus Parcubacteria bacterium]